jgi:hypothetical protein
MKRSQLSKNLPLIASFHLAKTCLLINGFDICHYYFPFIETIFAEDDLGCFLKKLDHLLNLSFTLWIEVQNYGMKNFD